jgi:hypothetical protein
MFRLHQAILVAFIIIVIFSRSQSLTLTNDNQSINFYHIRQISEHFSLFLARLERVLHESTWRNYYHLVPPPFSQPPLRSLHVLKFPNESVLVPMLLMSVYDIKILLHYHTQLCSPASYWTRASKKKSTLRIFSPSPHTPKWLMKPWKLLTTKRQVLI